MVLCEAEDRFLLLFGWALGAVRVDVVADAARISAGAGRATDALARRADASTRSRSDRAGP